MRVDGYWHQGCLRPSRDRGVRSARAAPWRRTVRAARVRRINPDRAHRELLYMKADAAILSQEPVGIVISRGADPEPAPAMFAYIWAPAPDPEEPRTSKVV